VVALWGRHKVSPYIATPNIKEPFISNDLEDQTMNQDIFEGKWKEMRGQVKEWWGELTDDDLQQMDGKADQLIGALQKRYGYTKEEAEKELNSRLEAAKVH
jgi:uncharacterized protein YjbJ (UPF0337 family)